MRITLNGNGIDIGTPGGTLGEVLSALDDMADKSGEVLVAVRLDGKELDAEGVSREGSRPLDGPGDAEVVSVPVRELRIRAFSSALSALDLAASGDGATDQSAAAKNWADWRDAFEGLLAADEASLSEWAAKELSTPSADGLADRLAPVRKAFAERLSESEDPERALAEAAAVWESKKGTLGEVPVLLQTARDREAMAAIVFCVELVNKVVRLLPELGRRGFDADAFTVDGAALPSFFEGLNAALRELMTSFEAKDAVAIGDVALYELEPKLDALFGAFAARFGSRGGETK
ncbi:MAG TPA: hypothetical protein PKW82_10105 [Spirochaetales bacterium]|nr:hypothetical protein [Spirochaetales bacterium]